MLTTLLNIWPIVISLVALACASIRLYIKIHDHGQEIVAIKQRHQEEIASMQHKIDVINDNYMDDVKEILARLQLLSDAVCKIQGYIEGQQASNR